MTSEENPSHPHLELHGREQPLSFISPSVPDWRVWLGLFLTVFWLALLSAYIAVTVGWQNIASTPIEQLGSFLEGAFAPLAFLWLVIGYFLQKKELVQNTDAIKMQYIEIQKSAQQAEIQSLAIQATEQHARREAFLRIADSVKQQLGAIMGFLYMSSQGVTGSGRVANDKVASLFRAMSQNDPEVFSRSMMELQLMYGERYAYKLLYGTPVRTRHSESFVFNFERLLRAADECDDDGMIRDSLLGGAHGFVYKRMVKFRDEPPDGLQYSQYDFDPDTID